ncbi:MAG: hypothetical protein ACOCUH_00480, partial [Bacteriovoracia bacterium]
RFLNYAVSTMVPLARVEGERHHVSDVMIGYAIGHVLTEFSYHLFFPNSTPSPNFHSGIAVTPDGGAGAFVKYTF